MSLRLIGPAVSDAPATTSLPSSWRSPPKCRNRCTRLFTASPPSDSRRERRRGCCASYTSRRARGERQATPSAQAGGRPRDTSRTPPASMASARTTETSSRGEDCRPSEEPGAVMRVRAAEAAGFVGGSGCSRDLSGYAFHSFVGSGRGALRPRSASTGAATIACQPHARTTASSTERTKPRFIESSRGCRQASAGPVGGCPHCEA
jgi:hypothetical protein